jgi:hypothetical protein
MRTPRPRQCLEGTRARPITSAASRGSPSHAATPPPLPRAAACRKAGVAPTFTDHEGDDASALALVISLNVQRRDMTGAQEALPVVARRWLPDATGGDRHAGAARRRRLESS